MQYKQARRIFLELFLSDDLPLKIKLKLVSMLLREHWQKLGPFKKRSPEQVLWKVASDTQRPGTERWAALEKLVEVVESRQEAKLDRMRGRPVRKQDAAKRHFRSA